MGILQVARAILENSHDKTKISLIYANVTYEDILLKVLILLYHIVFCCIWDTAVTQSEKTTHKKTPYELLGTLWSHVFL